MERLLERFCRYVRVDTQADEMSKTYPSTPGQLELGKMLASELKDMGLRDAHQDEFGIVMATVPANVSHQAPTVAYIAHVDTSPETTGKNVKPIVHRNYDGKDIVLPGDTTKVLRVADNPDLAAVKGKTVITTDGTTLLGSDDKSGVAVIMELAEYLLAHPEVKHGPVRICFSCDEEIGHGVDHIDLKKLGAHVGYTLDGGGQGEVDGETFSADLAVVTIKGINIHPSIGKGKMVNAIRLAGIFLDRMPRLNHSPETTCDREGFLHPYRIEGGVAETTMRILLRDFDTAKLAVRAEMLHKIAAGLRDEYPQAQIDVTVTAQYRNMADGMVKEPRALKFAMEATRKAGVEPRQTIIRGGTDGSRLTEIGLPTPNLSTAEHCIHSPLEWTCLEEMEQAVKVLVELTKLWGAEKA